MFRNRFDSEVFPDDYFLFKFFRSDANKVCCYAHPDAPLIEDYRAGDQICSECGLVVGDR